MKTALKRECWQRLVKHPSFTLSFVVHAPYRSYHSPLLQLSSGVNETQSKQTRVRPAHLGVKGQRECTRRRGASGAVRARRVPCAASFRRCMPLRPRALAARSSAAAALGQPMMRACYQQVCFALA